MTFIIITCAVHHQLPREFFFCIQSSMLFLSPCHHNPLGHHHHHHHHQPSCQKTNPPWLLLSVCPPHAAVLRVFLSSSPSRAPGAVGPAFSVSGAPPRTSSPRMSLRTTRTAFSTTTVVGRAPCSAPRPARGRAALAVRGASSPTVCSPVLG